MKTKIYFFFLYVMAVFYFLAGINHFIKPEFYLKLIPEFLPAHIVLNYVSGICEIVFAVLLLPIKTRRYAAWGIVLLLIAVFPANIKMFIDFWESDHPGVWISAIRLPLQLVFIWWAWIYTKQRRF